MKKLFEYLIKNKITPNGFFALYTLMEKIGYLGYIHTNLEFNKLEKEEFIVKSKTTEQYEVTKKGRILLKDAENIMSKIKKTIVSEDWEKKIIEYNELFPKGKRSNSNIGYRRNPKELRNSFIWFFKEYPEYTWDDVLNITKQYIESQNGDYTYLQNSKYFIKKMDVNKTVSSTIADLLYNAKEGNDVLNTDVGTQYFGED